MLKKLAKSGLAAALNWSGANALIGKVSRREPLVLGYHSVVPDIRAHAGRAIPANLISVAMLEQQLDWIGRRYQFISLDEVGAHVEKGEPIARPSAAVTFDDGYAGVYHHALPLLQRKGIPAAMFVVTEAIGRGQLQIYDKLYLLLTRVMPILRHSESRLLTMLDAYGIRLHASARAIAGHDIVGWMRHLFTTLPQHRLRRVVAALESVARIDDADFPDLHAMTWDMVSTLDRCGMTVGSHTQTHALLTIETPDRMANQLTGSARTLQHRLGKPVAHFAYPDGRFNPAVVSTVAHAGYRWAYTTCGHRDAQRPALTIPRTLLWENACLDHRGRFSSSLMGGLASGVFNWMAPCRQRHDSDYRQAPAGAAGASYGSPQNSGSDVRRATFSQTS
jgi:peptidoglycan/xylan/chitin deacetylase (PgdA/CDA1 family)